jgi:hypothetical protein
VVAAVVLAGADFEAVVLEVADLAAVVLVGVDFEVADSVVVVVLAEADFEAADSAVVVLEEEAVDSEGLHLPREAACQREAGSEEEDEAVVRCSGLLAEGGVGQVHADAADSARAVDDLLEAFREVPTLCDHGSSASATDYSCRRSGGGWDSPWGSGTGA